MLRIVLLLLLVITPAQSPRVDRGRYATQWNEAGKTIDHLNEGLIELSDNLKANPPWRVDSPPTRERRRELYERSAADCEKLAHTFRRLKELEQ